MKDKPRIRAIRLLKVCLAAGIFYWLLSSGRLDFRGLAALEERWHWLLIAQLIFGVTQLLVALRWRLLMRVQGIEYTLVGAFNLTLAGIFFNQLFIGATGGDLYRAYAVASDNPQKRSPAIISVIVDRVFGLLALLLLVPLAALWSKDLVSAHVELYSFTILALIAFALGLVFLGVIFSKRLREASLVRSFVAKLPLRELRTVVDANLMLYRSQLPAMSVAAILSVAIQLLVIVTNICLALALLRGPLDWVAFFLLIPMAHAAMALPINPPGALGTAEAMYAYLLGFVGIAQGSLICVLQRLTFLLWAAPGAIIFVLRKDSTRSHEHGSAPYPSASPGKETLGNE